MMNTARDHIIYSWGNLKDVPAMDSGTHLQHIRRLDAEQNIQQKLQLEARVTN